MDKRIIEETPSSEVLNDDWFIKDSPTSGTSKILGSNLKDIISGDVENAIDKILDSIATEWRANESYSNGTYVMYEGELYECFVNGSTVGQFKKNTEWLHRTVNSMVKDVIRMIAQRFYASTVSPPSLTPYSKGDLVWYSQPYHEDELYICKQDLPNGDTEWVPEHWDKVTDISGLSKYLMDKIEEAGQIDDVQVKTTGDYESVVDENKVAKIDLSNMLIEKSVPNLPQSVATFNDGSDLPLKSLTASIVPVQDLHGYDSPWVGGSGKNKLPLSFTDGSSVNGITIYKNADGTVKITGKATSQAVITIGEYTTPTNQSIKYSGSVGGSASTYSINIAVNGGYNYADIYDGDSSAVSVSANDVIREVIVVRSGYECPTSGIIFYPMIRNSSESFTFTPYSNICPISGWDEANVVMTGKNLLSFNALTDYSNWKGDLITYGDFPTSIYNRGYELDMIEAGETYTISLGITPALFPTYLYLCSGDGTSTVRLNYFTTNTYYNKEYTFTAETGKIYYLRCGSLGNLTDFNNNFVSKITNAQVELGSEATTYEPYAGTTYTIPFTDGQGQSRTCMGGYFDVINGPLTEDVKFYDDLKNITFELSANGQYYWSRSTTIPYALNQSDGMCSHFKFSSSGDVFCGTSDATGHYILFYKSKIDSALGISSVAEFNTWLANQSTNGTPVQLWYKLATPNAPIQQHPTSIKSLDGENNVSASTGDIVSGEYIADASLVIANLDARITALENA